MAKTQDTIPLLIINKENFDDIIEGRKQEEYRSLSDHYFRMFCTKGKDGVYDDMKPIDKIYLAVGYSKDRKKALIEAKDIYVCTFINDIPEGFQKGDECFVIELGKVLEKNF